MAYDGSQGWTSNSPPNCFGFGESFTRTKIQNKIYLLLQWFSRSERRYRVCRAERHRFEARPLLYHYRLPLPFIVSVRSRILSITSPHSEIACEVDGQNKQNKASKPTIIQKDNEQDQGQVYFYRLVLSIHSLTFTIRSTHQQNNLYETG